MYFLSFFYTFLSWDVLLRFTINIFIFYLWAVSDKWMMCFKSGTVSRVHVTILFIFVLLALFDVCFWRCRDFLQVFATHPGADIAWHSWWRILYVKRTFFFKAKHCVYRKMLPFYVTHVCWCLISNVYIGISISNNYIFF